MTQITIDQINPGAATDKQVIAFDQPTGKFTVQDQTGTGTGGGNIVFVSDPEDMVEGIHTVTHNLNVAQSDIEHGRYRVTFSRYRASNLTGMSSNSFSNVLDDNTQLNVWSSANHGSSRQINWQENTMKIFFDDESSGSSVALGARIIIEDLRLQTGGLGSGADIGNNYLILTGTMAGTPPEVDIVDTRITDTTPFVVFFSSKPEGNITRPPTNGHLVITSDNPADAEIDVKVVFIGIGPARQYMKGVFAFTGTIHQILDPRIVASSAVVAMPRPTPVGYITGSTDVGEINFASTGTEIGVLVDYVVFNDGISFSDGMPYNPTLDDDDILFRKGNVSGNDEAVKWSDMRGGIQGAGTRVMMSISKTFDEGTTTTSYTHTLGRVPQYIRMDGVGSPGSVYISLGERFTGGIQGCVYSDTNSGGVSLTAVAVISYIGGRSQIGVISNVTSTGFDITWTYSSDSTPVFSMNFLVTLQ